MVVKFLVTPQDWVLPLGITYNDEFKVLFLRIFCFSIAIGKEE